MKLFILSGENELELGPFIPMSFIDGVCLRAVLGSDDDSRLLRESVPDSDVEYIYGQMADYMLQLFKIEFDQIGNLPTSKTRFNAPSRPLTWKVHEILRLGGVDTFCL